MNQKYVFFMKNAKDEDVLLTHYYAPEKALCILKMPPPDEKRGRFNEQEVSEIEQILKNDYPLFRWVAVPAGLEKPLSDLFFKVRSV